MDLALFAAIGGLGLAAVDVVGIAFMPILLAQERGLRRAIVFLAGSLLALVAMGLAFTTGLGALVVEHTRAMPWLQPAVEVFGGLVLLAIGAVLLVRARRGAQAQAPDNLVARLTLPQPLLFAFGAGLVAVQSVVDVVFVIAMVEVGTKGLPLVEVVALVLTYAVTALLIQVGVVVAYLATPVASRARLMDGFTAWLGRSGELWSGVVALGLGIGLLVLIGPDLLRTLPGR
jgi:MFS family permease